MTDTTEYVRGNWFRLTESAGGHPAGTLVVYTDTCCRDHDDIYTFVGDDHPGIIRLQPTSVYTRLTDIPPIGSIPRSMVERVVIPDGTPVTVTASNRRSSRFQEGDKRVIDRTEPATSDSLERFYLGLEWVYPVDFTVDAQIADAVVPPTARTFSVGDSFYIENPSLLRTANDGNVYWTERTEPSRFEVARTTYSGVVTDEPRNIYGRLYAPDGRAIMTTGSIGTNEIQYVSSSFLAIPWDDRPVPETVEKAEHDRIVVNLQAEVARLLTWQEQAMADASALNDRLNDEARDRGWCDDYERILGEVPLNVLEFAGRGRTFSATREVEVTVSVTQNGTYTGASSDPDEDDFEWSNITTDDIEREVGYGNYTITDETSDFESSED